MSTGYAIAIEESGCFSSQLDADSTPISQSEALNQFHELQSQHQFWHNRLFRACRQGYLTLDDFQFIFSQYYLYSKNFTRYIAALMANSDNDYHRSRLSENLWEEGGGTQPDKRHAELFRRFLREALSINPATIEYSDSAAYFVSQYLDFCLKSHPMAVSAFLSLGTEGIVARMYSIFVDGMQKAGIGDGQLEFFNIHIACDDDHALTLEKIMLSYSDQPDWYDSCLRAMDCALTLRSRFFDSLYEGLQRRRLKDLMDHIQSREAARIADPTTLVWRQGCGAIPLYNNTSERLNVQFAVERLPLKTEALDPRIVRIPIGKYNEKHRHAHETIFYVMSGEGRIVVDSVSIGVKPGDVVHVPRWAVHQSQNTGDTELVILAVTDFGLTGRAFVGDYNKTARIRTAIDVAQSVRQEN